MLLVNHRFHPAEGGTERWALGQARALQKKGVAVSVLTQAEPGSPAEEDLGGIEVHRIPMRHLGGFRVPRGYWRALRGLDRDVLSMSGNRIWCADFYFPVANVLDGPQTITPHDFYQWMMDPSPRNRWYFTQYLPGRLRAFDGYLALTQHESSRVQDWGVPASQIHVVGEGLDLAEVQHAPEIEGLRERWKVTRPNLAYYVGGLWPNKRVDRLVRALAPVRDQCSLVVVGRDIPGHNADQTHIETLARELGVEVRCVGAIPRAELLAGYKEADLYLLGSQYEGFGLSLLEAMAAGLPFVAYDVGAASQLAAQGGGFAASDDKEFTRLVGHLVGDPGHRNEMSRRALAAAPGWDWDAVIDRYLAVYHEASKRGGRKV